MPRPRREDYEGAWQHVMNRGTGRAKIFIADADRGVFLECLEELRGQTLRVRPPLREGIHATLAARRSRGSLASRHE